MAYGFALRRDLTRHMLPLERDQQPETASSDTRRVRPSRDRVTDGNKYSRAGTNSLSGSNRVSERYVRPGRGDCRASILKRVIPPSIWETCSWTPRSWPNCRDKWAEAEEQLQLGKFGTRTGSRSGPEVAFDGPIAIDAAVSLDCGLPTLRESPADGECRESSTSTSTLHQQR